MSSTSAAPGLRAGDPAPDATVRDAAGIERTLSHYWAAAPRALALVFVRHFG